MLFLSLFNAFILAGGLDDAYENLLIAAVRVATLVLIGLGTFLFGKAQAWLKAKMGNEQYTFARDFVTSVVRSLEQQGYLNLDGAGKKERAVVLVTQKLQEMGIPVSADVIDMMIEEAVQVMNAELGTNIS